MTGEMLASRRGGGGESHLLRWRHNRGEKKPEAQRLIGMTRGKHATGGLQPAQGPTGKGELSRARNESLGLRVTCASGGATLVTVRWRHGVRGGSGSLARTWSAEVEGSTPTMACLRYNRW